MRTAQLKKKTRTHSVSATLLVETTQPSLLDFVATALRGVSDRPTIVESTLPVLG